MSRNVLWFVYWNFSSLSAVLWHEELMSCIESFLFVFGVLNQRLYHRTCDFLLGFGIVLILFQWLLERLQTLLHMHLPLQFLLLLLVHWVLLSGRFVVLLLISFLADYWFFWYHIMFVLIVTLIVWASAILAHFILKERLHQLGILGCVMCIAGSVIIVIHAPQEHPITSVQEIWSMATQPG